MTSSSGFWSNSLTVSYNADGCSSSLQYSKTTNSPLAACKPLLIADEMAALLSATIRLIRESLARYPSKTLLIGSTVEQLTTTQSSQLLYICLITDSMASRSHFCRALYTGITSEISGKRVSSL